MKKIYSFVFAAIAILSAASCQKESFTEDEVNAAPFSFVGSRDVETKTVLVDGKSTYWTVGDKVSAFDNSGAAVSFVGTHTETTESALFYSPSYNIPSNYEIHAIYPDRTGSATMANGVISNLRIAGTQQAVAGSFDPAYGIAYAKGVVTDPTTPPTMEFSNIHSLVKFTVVGDTAPQTISLKSFAMRMCVGLYTYSTVDGTITPTAGAGEVTLTAPKGGFKVGDTYYIALIPGATKNLTIYMDGLVAFEAGADVVRTLEPNKIYNLGELSVPVPEKTASVAMQATSVLSKKSNSTSSWLPSIGVPANQDRNAAFDGTNVYIANVNTTTAEIKTIPVADPENVTSVNVEGVSGGHFPISCIRTIPNGAEHVLIASSMGGVSAGQPVNIYAWDNGVDAAPTVLCDKWPAASSRRWGDQFTVCGTWENGELWFRSQQSATTAKYAIKNGVLQNPGLPDGWGNIASDQVYLGSVYRYNMSSAELLVVPGAVNAALYDFSGNKTALARPYGYVGGFTPFEYGGKKFIAYIELPGLSAKSAKLVVIEDTDGDFETALNDALVVFTADLAETGNTQVCSNSGMSCNVVTKDGKTYLFGHAQNLGIAVYEITGLTALN